MTDGRDTLRDTLEDYQREKIERFQRLTAEALVQIPEGPVKEALVWLELQVQDLQFEMEQLKHKQ